MQYFDKEQSVRIHLDRDKRETSSSPDDAGCLPGMSCFDEQYTLIELVHILLRRRSYINRTEEQNFTINRKRIPAEINNKTIHKVCNALNIEVIRREENFFFKRNALYYDGEDFHVSKYLNKLDNMHVG